MKVEDGRCVTKPIFVRDCPLNQPSAECVANNPVPAGEVELTVFIWAVVLNILSILLVLVGYLALGVLIYGGSMYVLSTGDASKIAGAKRTIIAAVIGLAICILASLIAGTIVSIITGATTTSGGV
jgi:hypothetical protein